MNVKMIFAGLSILFLMSACTNDSDSLTIQNNSYPGVSENLWPYFNSFEQEAEERGLKIDLVGLDITGIVQDIDDNGVAGTCQYGSHIAHVTIDLSYWNNSSMLTREYVVFHELGHCALGRDHDESSFNNGICQSIMNSGLGHCIPSYNNQNRERYLDELFLESE